MPLDNACDPFRPTEQQPRNPIGVPTPPIDASVYLAPVGSYPPSEADLLVSHYREKLGLEIAVLAPVRVPAEAFDRAREQAIAERLIDALSRTAPAVTDPSAVVIGLTNADMYIAARDWRYAYSLRAQDRFPIVSTARMGDGLFVDEVRRMRRIQKMVTKNSGCCTTSFPRAMTREACCIATSSDPMIWTKRARTSESPAWRVPCQKRDTRASQQDHLRCVTGAWTHASLI